MATKFISDIAHYNEVLSKVAAVKRSLWIGTADIKDLHVKMGSATAPFLGLLAQLLKRGHRHEKRQPKELRGGHPHRRSGFGGGRHGTVRQRMARRPLRHLRKKGFLH